MKTNYIINIFIITIIILSCFYLTSIIIFHDANPSDIYHQYLGTSLTFQDLIFTKRFHKYSFYGSIGLTWPYDKDIPNVKWDSAWGYSLNIKGFNNLTHSIYLDSILIFDDIAKPPKFKCKCKQVTIKAKNEFSFITNLEDGFTNFIENGIQYDPFNPNIRRTADTINDISLNYNSLFVKLVTSVNSKLIKIEHYKVISL
jgi:hypothetical protein